MASVCADEKSKPRRPASIMKFMLGRVRAMPNRCGVVPRWRLAGTFIIIVLLLSGVARATPVSVTLSGSGVSGVFNYYSIDGNFITDSNTPNNQSVSFQPTSEAVYGTIDFSLPFPSACTIPCQTSIFTGLIVPPKPYNAFTVGANLGPAPSYVANDLTLGSSGGHGTFGFTPSTVPYFVCTSPDPLHCTGGFTYSASTFPVVALEGNAKAFVSYTVGTPPSGTGSGVPTPGGPPPPNFTQKLKTVYAELASVFGRTSTALGLLSAITDPYKLVLKGATAGASFLVDQFAPQVGLANSTVQTVLSGVSLLQQLSSVAPGTNPVTIAASGASLFSKIISLLLKVAANDPPDPNFTTVESPIGPRYNLPSSMTGDPGFAVSNALLNDQQNLLSDLLLLDTAAERFEGAEGAGDAASQVLQNTAFNAALQSSYPDAAKVAADLTAFEAILQPLGYQDVNFSAGDCLAMQSQLASQGLSSLYAQSLVAAAVNPAAVQQILLQIESMSCQADAFTGSAFSVLDNGAASLAGYVPDSSTEAVPEPASTAFILPFVVGIFWLEGRRRRKSPSW